MRTFGSDFALAIAQDYVDSWFSVDFPVQSRTLYLAEREHDFGGNTYLPLIPADGIGDLVSGVRRAAKTFEIQGLDIPILNMVLDELDGFRFSDFIDDAFESRAVTVYLNVKDSGGVTRRHVVFKGKPSRPIAFNMVRATVKLTPLSELYLNRPVLRTINTDDFPDAPDTDLGKGIPLVVGAALHVIGVRYYQTGVQTFFAICEYPESGNMIFSLTGVTWDGTIVVGGIHDTSVSAGSATVSLGDGVVLTRAQPITFINSFPLWKITLEGVSQVGTPTEPITVALYRAQYAGGPPSDERVASTTAVLTGGDAVATFPDMPLVTVGNDYVIVFSTNQNDVANYYEITSGTVDGGWRVIAGGVWSDAGGTGAAFTIEAPSIAMGPVFEGTGNRVVHVAVGAVVPDSVRIGVFVSTVADHRVPTKFAEWLLLRAGYSAGDIDTGGTFATSATLYGTDHMGGVIIDPSATFKSVLLQVAFEHRAIFDWPVDKALWKYIETTPTVVDTIDLSAILTEGLDSPLPRITVTRTDVADVVNSIDVLYLRDWTLPRGVEAYRATEHAEDATSIATWGRRTNPDLFMFDFVVDVAVAEDRAAFYVAQLKNPKDEVVFTAPLTKLALEKDDVLAFDVA